MKLNFHFIKNLFISQNQICHFQEYLNTYTAVANFYYSIVPPKWPTKCQYIYNCLNLLVLPGNNTTLYYTVYIFFRKITRELEAHKVVSLRLISLATVACWAQNERVVSSSYERQPAFLV